jgi:putative ABC transport system ATP-binding protein
MLWPMTALALVPTLPRLVRPAVAAAGLTRVYGDGFGLRDIALEVPEGEFLAVTGPSGSGKSTLLHLLAGLDTPDAGVVRLAGEDIAQMADGVRRAHIGFVFRTFTLMPTLTLEENVLLPLTLAGRRPAPGALDALLARAGLAHLRHVRAAQLTGGEQQLTAIARALVSRPTVLFADEPAGELDADEGAAVLELLRSAGTTVVMATTDARAAAAADRVLRLSGGRLVAGAGAVERPAHGAQQVIPIERFRQERRRGIV